MCSHGSVAQTPVLRVAASDISAQGILANSPGVSFSEEGRDVREAKTLFMHMMRFSYQGPQFELQTLWTAEQQLMIVPLRITFFMIFFFSLS